MHDARRDHIGRRVRIARLGQDLSQEQLGGLVSRGGRWVQEVEAGRLVLDKVSLICAVAEVCDVDVNWLLGQPYRLRQGESTTAHIPALRTVLRRSGLILSGHPGLSASAPPAGWAELEQMAAETNAARQGARLLDAARVLPVLLEALNTALLSYQGAERERALALVVDAARNARQSANVLGYPDLAWTASEVAAGAATQLGDPLSQAATAWDRCGAMLHQGDVRSADAIADAALADLDPLLAEGGHDAVALHGALLLRRVVAAARSDKKVEAWQHSTAALAVARTQLPDGYADLRWHTVFGVPVVAVHAVEAGVEIDEPDKGLSFVPGLDVEARGVTPSRERVTHWRIDKARAEHRLGRTHEAITTLHTAARHAPAYVYAHPMARTLVDDMVTSGAGIRSAGLASLVRHMEIQQ
ncbi:helix-turn-helix domain-containing protein [Streptomyces sp. NBC_00237]|uniref:helix-turn-helix domain-containing protein n=1 Tax=Streptomyces sp. NBC_00237 TaxID=2975687 RepID=UPI00225BAB03|nr:helix-turn-helix domain-containing protein [Streptomyces sp. NBC_00237]MCX5207702.1 helix-turn-helix domain-containing protein [Streptomyces sp. NBC_00237]